MTYTLQSTGNLSNSTVWSSGPVSLRGLDANVTVVLVDPASPTAPAASEFFYLEPLGFDGTAVSWTSNGTTFRKVIPDVVTGLSSNGHYSSANLDIFWKVGGALQADPFTLDTAVPADELEKLEDFQAALPAMLALPPNSPIIVKLGAPLASPPAQRQFWRLSLSVIDSDNDGTPDNGEFDGGYRTNPYSSDTDGDLLTDASEIAGGTNPAGNDSDNDGVPDNDEVRLESETQSKSLFKQGFLSFATTSPPRKFLWKTTTWNPNYIGSIVPFDPDIIKLGGRNTFVNQLNGQEFSFPVVGLYGSLNYQPVTVVGTPTATTRNSAMPWSASGMGLSPQRPRHPDRRGNRDRGPEHRVYDAVSQIEHAVEHDGLYGELYFLA